MKELLDKLVSVLKAHGLAEEEIEKVKLELSEEPENKESEEKPEEEPEATSEEDSVAEGEEEVEESEESKPVESEPSEEEKPAEEPPMEQPEMESEAEPVAEESEQPMEEPEKPELPEGVEEMNPEAPMVEEPMEPQGPSAADFERVLSRLDEKDKAIEGLQAKVESLLEALEKAGVVSNVQHMSNEVGIDDGTRVMDFHSDETAVDDIVNELNKKRF